MVQIVEQSKLAWWQLLGDVVEVKDALLSHPIFKVVFFRLRKNKIQNLKASGSASTYCILSVSVSCLSSAVP